MNKKLLFPLALVPLAATSLQAQKSAQTQRVDKRPNIILFMVDDMGWQDTSLPFWTQKTDYNKLYETPNMERLAKQGMMFTQAYASSISSPTRCSLITGTNAARHRVTNWTLHRVGELILLAYACVNIMPCLASRSMLGVSYSLL